VHDNSQKCFIVKLSCPIWAKQDVDFICRVSDYLENLQQELGTISEKQKTKTKEFSITPDNTQS